MIHSQKRLKDQEINNLGGFKYALLFYKTKMKEFKGTKGRELLEALELSKSHLEYCGYGDEYEICVAIENKLDEIIQQAIKNAKG